MLRMIAVTSWSSGISEAVAVVAALCPLACWALLTRTRVIGALVAGVLVLGAVLALAVALGWWSPATRVGLLLAYVPVTTVVVCGGVLLERRQLTRRPGELISWRRASGWLLLAVFAVGFGLMVAPLVLVTRSFTPATLAANSFSRCQPTWS